MIRTYTRFLVSLFAFVAVIVTPTVPRKTTAKKKIGLLLVNHGSRSAAWRASLMQLEKNVRPKILAEKHFADVRTAFMEYTEPSIATRMKEFDAEGFTDVVLVPIFLTVSPHPFDDIPTIIGQKNNPESREAMRLEKIERYTPKAKVVITPLLDFTDILEKNLIRRVKALSKDKSKEALVMIAYGDEKYENEWNKLFDNMGASVRKNLGIQDYSHGWCGHLVHYNPSKTTEAIEKVAKKGKRALVVPVLVAVDEMFQGKIIPQGVEKARKAGYDVVYKPDSILPDKGLEDWVVKISRQYVQKL